MDSTIKESLFLETGCNEDVQHLEDGQAYRMLDGSVYQYRCKHGFMLVGQGTLFCDGIKWSGEKPICQGTNK